MERVVGWPGRGAAFGRGLLGRMVSERCPGCRMRGTLGTVGEEREEVPGVETAVLRRSRCEACGAVVEELARARRGALVGAG